MNDAPHVDPLTDGAWFRDLLRRDAAGMDEQDGRGDPMLLETGIDREEALALARFHDVEERGCRIFNRFSEAEYHSARSERFWNALNRLELEGEVDRDEVDQAANQVRNPADLREGGEIVGGSVVDMQEPVHHLPVALHGDDGVLIGCRNGPERSA